MEQKEMATFNTEKIKIIVFDVDDTLTRGTLGVKIGVWKDLFFDQLEKMQEARELYEFTGKGDRYNIIAHVIDVPQSEAHEDNEVAELAKKFEEETVKAIRNQDLHEDDVNALAQLRLSFETFYILSATPTAAVTGNIKHFEEKHPEIAGMFVEVIGTPMENGKGGELIKIAENNSVEPESILMVGDGESDRTGAENAGTQFVAIIPEGKEDKWPEKDFPKTHSVSDLPHQLSA